LLSQSRFVLEIVNQASLYACVPRESSVPTELALGHLRCRVTDMPPQPNSPSGRCLETRLPCTPEGGRLAQNSPRSRAHEVIPARRRGPREGANAIKPRPRRCIARRRTQNHWSHHSISEATTQVVVFHFCLRCHLYYTSGVAAQSQTGVKLNRVFFPRLALQVRSLDCRFAR
jgi:hypothetical protein